MKKAAVASMAVLATAAMAVSGYVKAEEISEPVAEKTQDAVVSSEGETVTDPLIPEIDTGISIQPGARVAVVSKDTKGVFWELVRKGMEGAVADVNEAYDLGKGKTVTMTFEGPDDERNVENQINTLDAVIAENPAVVCLSAGDMDSCQAQLEAARENGIPVVVFDSTIMEEQLVDAYRGTDNIKVGEIAAERLGAALGGRGKIAVFSAQEKTSSVQERVLGFRNGIKAFEGIEIIKIIYQDQVEDMAASMQTVLEYVPDLAGVYCTNADISEMYLGLEKPENKDIVMVGTDATDRQQEAVQNGEELGIVSQNPYAMGYQTILAALSLTGDGENVEREVFLPPQWIDRANLTEPEHSGYIY